MQECRCTGEECGGGCCAVVSVYWGWKWAGEWVDERKGFGMWDVLYVRRNMACAERGLQPIE